MNCTKRWKLGVVNNRIEGISKRLLSCGLSKQTGIIVSFKARKKIHIMHVILVHKQSSMFWGIQGLKNNNKQSLHYMTAEINVTSTHGCRRRNGFVGRKQYCRRWLADVRVCWRPPVSRKLPRGSDTSTHSERRSHSVSLNQLQILVVTEERHQINDITFQWK